MIYFWRTPDKYYESEEGDDLSGYIGIYDEKNGPSTTVFSGYVDGKKLSFLKSDLVFKFNVKKLDLSVMDVLMNDGGFIIVNDRVKRVLDNYASEDLQYLKATIKCIDGELDGYYVVNILSRIMGIDKEKTKCKYFAFDPEVLSGFDGTMFYKHDSLEKHNIAIEREMGFVAVSQDLKNALTSLQPTVNEIKFLLPEDIEW